MISISISPGGNEVALADPEHFAVRFTKCSRCAKLWCDRCGRARCACGAALRTETPGERLAHFNLGGPAAATKEKLVSFDLGSRAAQRIKGLALPVAMPTAPAPGEPRFLATSGDEKIALVYRARELLFGGGTPAMILDALDRAIALDPRFAEAFALRGWVHVLAGSPDKAAGDLAAALEASDPSWPSRIDVAADLAALR
jgi:hypothetical protein